MYRKVILGMAALALGGGLVAANGATAGAAPLPDAHATGGTAPACVARVVDEQPDGQHVWVDNECGKTMHIKIVVSGASDTGCNTLRDGQTREWVLKLGSYDKTVVC